MPRLGVRLLALVTSITALAACRTGALDLSGAGSPIPSLTATPTPPASPTPTLLPFGNGNGQDGPLNVSSPTTLNVCHALITGSGSTLTLDSYSSLQPADVLVLVQVQDDLGATSGDPTTIPADSVPEWEMVRISSLSTVAQVSPALRRAYQSGGNRHAEACLVPEYTDLTIAVGGSLRAAPWSGTTGGLVAVLVNGTLSLAGTVDASTFGFRGGLNPALSSSAGVTVMDLAIASGGGGKGESIDGRAFALGGAGNIANGGGGGNPYAAGGGGGGNGAAGGDGGKETSGGSGVANTRGLAGAGLLSGGMPHLRFGGGGGAGARGSTNSTSEGSAGGGAVLLVAGTLSGAGAVHADGVAGKSQVDDFLGGSGGGAGGSIVILATNLSGFSGAVTVRGGNGGHGVTDAAGSGGGGGGGRIYAPNLPVGQATLTGGAGGTGNPAGLPGGVGVLEP